MNYYEVNISIWDEVILALEGGEMKIRDILGPGAVEIHFSDLLEAMVFWMYPGKQFQLDKFTK